MSNQFIKDRSSHLTISTDHIYTEIYKIAPEVGTLVAGDKVVIKLTTGAYKFCVVSSADPLILSEYTGIRYVREDVVPVVPPPVVPPVDDGDIPPVDDDLP